MNETELFQIMIVNAVEKAIQPLREDLKQIKALNAKILKEQANLVQTAPISRETPTFATIGRPSAPTLIEGQQRASQAKETAQLNSFLSQAAPFVQLQGSGELPDVDIPIEMFLKPR